MVGLVNRGLVAAAVAALAVRAAVPEDEDGSCPAGAPCGSEVGATKPPEYYWPRARGNPSSYMRTNSTMPFNLGKAFAWNWHYPDGKYSTVVRGNPLIDHEKNVLILTEHALFKLSPEGKEIWRYTAPTPHLHNHVPSIMDGYIYGSTVDSLKYKISLETGKEVWVRKYGSHTGGDTAYIEAYDGVVLGGYESSPIFGGGQHNLVGINATDGSELWHYRIDLPTWNFNPVFPKDGTFIFMDVSGGVYRLGLHDGRLVWHAKPSPPWWFTDGGVMIGPDNTAYSCSHLEDDRHGVLRAYRFEDGAKLWETRLRTGCTSWPAIASDNTWGAVPIGNFVKEPAVFLLPDWFPGWLKITYHELIMSLGGRSRWLPGLWSFPRTHTELFAFDTKTGTEKWSFRTPEWEKIAARGDDEGLGDRVRWGKSPICLPTSWGTPTISGDGTVYAGHVSGIFYAVKDADGNGIIDEATEVSSIDLQDAPLPNNPAWAPGMMAVATCGGLYVFKSDS